jgi:DnaK suppressor protein
MTTPSKTAAGRSRGGQERHRVLQALLSDRQRELQGVLRLRVRHPPAGGPGGGVDDTEQAEADVQEDIDVALIEMKAEALRRVRDALVRLAAGDYGNCIDCEGEIAAQRLRAVPFAVRCTACEDRREQAVAGERRSGVRQRSSMDWADQATS